MAEPKASKAGPKTPSKPPKSCYSGDEISPWSVPALSLRANIISSGAQFYCLGSQLWGVFGARFTSFRWSPIGPHGR